MLSRLTTKIALRKVGLPTSTDAFSFPEESNPKSDTSVFANPFGAISNAITIPKSWQSWQTPPPPMVEVGPSPVFGTRAPTCRQLPLPGADGRPTVVLFMRHCGCPFAEKTFLELRRLANKHTGISFIAVSHSSKAATDRWVSQIGGAWQVRIVIDEDREIYAMWGLGVSNTWYLLNPMTQWTQYKLGKEEGVWGREVDPSGNRWQQGGSWSCDGYGTIRWGGPSKSADEIPNLMEACQALGV